MKTYGRLSVPDDAPVPTTLEAIQTDIEMGSHEWNNRASDEFAKNYPTILAVALAQQKQLEREPDDLLCWPDGDHTGPHQLP